MKHFLRRGLTFVEVAVSLVIFSIVIFGVAGLVQSTTETSGLVAAHTDGPLEAQRILNAVREQLRRTGTGPGGRFERIVNPPANVDWEFQFHKILDGDIYDPTALDPLASIPWSTNRFSLRFEHIEDPVNIPPADDDGDFLFDEGRVALYEIDVTNGTETLVSVFGTNVRRFNVEVVNDARTRVQLSITMERILYGAVRGPRGPNGSEQRHLAIQQLQNGGGPRVNYTKHLWVTLPN